MDDDGAPGNEEAHATAAGDVRRADEDAPSQAPDATRQPDAPQAPSPGTPDPDAQ